MPICKTSWRSLAWILIGVCLLIAGPTRAAGAATFKAVLIYASDEPAPLDRRLEHIEFKLRRMLKFSHYRYMGGGELSLALPGEGAIQLGGGQQLKVGAAPADGGKIRVQVQWLRDGKVVLRTTVKLSRRSPAVLGGISDRKGKLIVSLTAQ